MNFSRNYNKKLGNHFFITIRLADPKWSVGKQYEIYDDQSCQTRGYAEIVNVRSLTVHDITDWLALLDAGMTSEEMAKELVPLYGPEIYLKPLQLLLVKRISLQATQGSLF